MYRVGLRRANVFRWTIGVGASIARQTADKYSGNCRGDAVVARLQRLIFEERENKFSPTHYMVIYFKIKNINKEGVLYGIRKD